MQERKDKWSVGEWMTPNPETIEPDLSVRDAFHRMRYEGFRHLIVCEDGALVGIITDRDLRRPDLNEEPDGWDESYELRKDFEVRFVMTRDVETASPGDGLEKALRLMIDRKFGALPVLDRNGDVIGILTSHDLLRAFDSALGEVGDRLRA